jgi:E3 ubiquitin-protein ligase TRIP12
LSSAIKVFSSPQTRKHVLEVEFYDEVGTGIGPTNEFYALVSKDLQRASHGIFRSEHSATPTTKTDNAESLVNAPHGLFPKPLRAVPNASKAIEIFRCVGRAIGKVLQDGRLLDVKFNPNFFKKLYGLPLCLDDLELLEPELFSTLKKLETAVRDGSGRLDGAKIEDLCLEFALPDGANIEGASVADEVVTAENASRYIAAVVDDVLGAGVEPLFQACREGFADIVSNPSQLAMFSLSEIDALTCGVDEQTKWSERDLREHILCDHGYQVNSKPVVNLREILTNMSDAERRSFLKFTTGSPRLPIGGLASLNPKLKVVCKQPTVLSEVGGGMNAAEMISEGTELADADLPSAMTCANYLKLPPYSSKEALELKLKLAISEGVGSFDLS